jgi:hypothetical protein
MKKSTKKNQATSQKNIVKYFILVFTMMMNIVRIELNNEKKSVDEYFGGFLK